MNFVSGIHGLSWLSLISICIGAPTSPTDILTDPTLDLSKPEQRALTVKHLTDFHAQRQAWVRQTAQTRGLPIRKSLPNGTLLEIEDFQNDSPLYRATHNSNAAISTGANILRNAPYNYAGNGLRIGVWDGGSARATHQEFGSRITVGDGAASIDHATHVAGTIAATGIVANARGMANLAQIQSYDWNNDVAEMTTLGATAPGQEATHIYLSNHSYGYVAGWVYQGNTGTPARMWEWYGSGTTNASNDPDFGRYDTYARGSDSLAYNTPYYTIFRSAGNDRGDTPTAGSMVALSPGSTSVVAYDASLHPAPDNTYRGGYDTISYDALAKNVITIGSVTDAVAGGIRSLANAQMSAFSSWGPTDDGRIKPDLVANGDNLYSSLNSSDTAYGSYSGTSMATPNACGTAALIIDHFRTLFPAQAMRSSTLKGLLIHTADDLGTAGPDYQYGWGLINAKRAADHITEHQQAPSKQKIIENQISTTTTSRTYTFLWDGVSPIRATLCWTDPAGDATTTSDFRSPRLKNNLQLKIIDPDQTTHLPFVMPFVGDWSQAAMSLAATTGENNTDTVEQILIPNPPRAGTYQVVVSFSGTLTNNLQNFSLLLSGSSADAPPPLPLALASVSPNSAISSGSTTLTLTGTSLTSDTSVRLTKSGNPDIIATNVTMNGDALTCQVDLTLAASGLWSVVASKNSETSTLTDAFSVISAIWADSLDPANPSWSSVSTLGTNSWTLTNTQSQSPSHSYFASAPATRSTTYLQSPSIYIPAAANQIQLKFWHYLALSGNDSGRLEVSINQGPWLDVTDANSGLAFASNGYNASLRSTIKSDFAGKSVWKSTSSGFVETIVNFSDPTKFTGKSIRFRWGLASDDKFSSTGWYIDSFTLIAGGNTSNTPPTILTLSTTAAISTVDDTNGVTRQVLNSTSAPLTTTASDDGGESNLSYSWSCANGPASVSFSPSGTNLSKNTTAYFNAAGDYDLLVTVKDAQGLNTSQALPVRVNQVPCAINIIPGFVSLKVGATQVFTAQSTDQFSNPLNTQPASFTWSTTGGGSIQTNGSFSATTAGGPYTITAADSGFTGVANVTVTRIPASLTFSNLSQVYDGTPKTPTITTNPTGLLYSVTYNGTNTPPTNQGSYAIEAAITDPNYQGSASATFTITAPSAVSFSSWVASEFTPTEQTNGLADPSADPDADGLQNLIEFALGTPPKTFTSLPPPSIQSNQLVWFLTRPSNRTGINYSALSSDSFNSWQPASLEVISSTNNVDTLKISTPTNPNGPTRFLRLKVESP